jgi:phosphate uptake regulator
MRTADGGEARRIQKTGGSTFIVSLPKAWVVSRGLGSGDVLLFHGAPDGSLMLRAESGMHGETPRRELRVSNDMNTEHLFRLLVAEYIAGAPLLEVRTEGRMNARTREVVRGFAQRMIGPEILEETADGVVLQDVIGPNPLPIASVIRRMYQMVRAMQSDAMAAFHARDPSIARDVIERDWEVDRLHWFIGKQITSALRDGRVLSSIGLTLPECATYLLASRVLERIADHAVRIAETVPLVGKEPIPAGVMSELDRLALAAAEGLTGAIDSLANEDIAKANEVLDAAARVTRERETILKELTKKRGRLAVALAYVLESLERSAFYASDLAEIAINHTVQRSAQTETPVVTPAAPPAAKLSTKVPA